MKAKKIEANNEDKRDYISQLPEELLLKIWRCLAALPPEPLSERELILQRFPFRTFDNPCVPHPGLRAYPFLGQVCKQWKSVLEKPEARRLIWDELVVDFSHELITSVHTPIAWSDKRPSSAEFKKSFTEIRLDTCKILDYVKVRSDSLKKIVLMSSEGYFSEDGEFNKFVNKHDFDMLGFGMLCGMLLDTLEELTVVRCNDFFDVSSSGLSAVKALRSLKALRLEEVSCGASNGNVIQKLSTLSQLTELSLTANNYCENWLGNEHQACWLGMSSLQKLTLTGHSQFTCVPWQFARLPLTHLDLGFSRLSDISALKDIQSLKVLSLQNISGENFSQPDEESESIEEKVSEVLEHLTNLTALNLSENNFTRVPLTLSLLTGLEYLDLSANEPLQVPKPLNALYNLHKMKILDARDVHKEEGISYWSADKCTTMDNLAAWSRALKRKSPHVKVLLEHI